MKKEEKPLTRRCFLRHTFLSFTAPAFLGVTSVGRFLAPFGGDELEEKSTKASARLQSVQPSSKIYEKKLSFYNIHTGESLKNLVFWAGDYVTDNVHLFNKLFRDHRTGDMKGIDLGLLDLLHKLNEKLDVSAPFHLISGYRSPKTNAMLHEKSSGVAKVSQHTFGKAADIALPGRCSLQDLYKAAKALGLGGAGIYSQFVHVDVGRVRYW